MHRCKLPGWYVSTISHPSNIPCENQLMCVHFCNLHEPAVVYDRASHISKVLGGPLSKPSTLHSSPAGMHTTPFHTCCSFQHFFLGQDVLPPFALTQVVARFLIRELEYKTPIPHAHTLVGSPTAAPAQSALPPGLFPFFEAAAAEGMPVIYVAFGSGPTYAKVLMPEDYLVLARALGCMTHAKVCVGFCGCLHILEKSLGKCTEMVFESCM